MSGAKLSGCNGKARWQLSDYRQLSADDGKLDMETAVITTS